MATEQSNRDSAWVEEDDLNVENANGHNEKSLNEKMHAVAQDLEVSTKCNTFSRETYKETDEFLKIMRAYQDEFDDPSLKAFNLNGDHPWQEVLQKAVDAQHNYFDAGKTKTSRRLARTFTIRADAASPFIRLIPNDKPLSVLSGGLALVIDAFSKIGEHREKILRALLRIPDVIMRAEDCCKIFPDQSLYERSEFLYRAALAAIEGVTRWLTQKPLPKILRALSLGPVYSKSFDEKMRTLDETVKAMETRIDVLRDDTIRRTGQNVEDIHKTAKAHRDRLEEIRNLIQDQNKHAEWIKRQERLVKRLDKRVSEIERASGSMDYHDFLDMLDVHGQHPACDLRWSLRASQSVELGGVEAALSTIKGDSFQQWQMTDRSAALFIEGRMLACRRSSPMSYLSTQLIQTQDESDEAIVIYFFCGSHTSTTDASRRKDTLFGPLGMMRSLICQLLRQYDLNVDFISHHLKSQLESPKNMLRALCKCFKILVRQLPVNAVLFCVIDGICFFEKSDMGEDCPSAIYELHDLAFEELNAVFKLLVTSPMRSRRVAELFPPESHLSMHQQVVERRAPTERELFMATARQSSKQKEFRMSLRPQPSEDEDNTDVHGNEHITSDDTEDGVWSG